MKEGVLVVDVGTSKVHTNIIDTENGEILLSKIEPFKWSHPKEGWSEADVNQEWEATQKAVGSIVEESKGKINLNAVALSTIGGGLLFMDQHGDPVGNMILPMDGRAKKEGQEIYEAFEQKNSGPKGMAGNMPGAKVLWFKRNRPEDFKRVAIIGHIQQFFTWKLGFGPVTDRGLATGFYNSETGQWNTELCDFLGFSTDKLGKLPVSADTFLGVTKNFGSVNFDKEIPVVLGTYDVGAGLLGLGCLPGSDAVLGDVTGTWEQIGCLVSDKEAVKKMSPLMMCGPIENSFIVLGAQVSGPNLDWFIHTFFPDEGLAAINRLFDLYPLDGMNKVFMTKDINSGDGTIRGLSLTSTVGDIFKGIIEGLTFPWVSTVKNFETVNGRKFGALRVGGGSAKSDKWSQLKADIFDIRVEKVRNIEITSLGTAIIAAVGIGKYPDYQTAMKQMIGIEKTYEPNHLLTERYQERYQEFLEKQRQG
ncbi:MAG: FGGY-family carbohydrate kinase [Deltaproteobacteria bacterium]|nr:FGGY-family carbohydrate kinase [Deltaproteobacteria bacterium]